MHVWMICDFRFLRCSLCEAGYSPWFHVWASSLICVIYWMCDFRTKFNTHVKCFIWSIQNKLPFNEIQWSSSVKTYNRIIYLIQKKAAWIRFPWLLPVVNWNTAAACTTPSTVLLVLLPSTAIMLLLVVYYYCYYYCCCCCYYYY